ncbi:hypothetical protein [Natronorubrum sp. A-ect3]|uniref:hypothetical protein n=1 Tax=Natronorubrum sp. A-ect3 TaxID=3242698 RepID=UPI00359E1C4D
MSRRSRRSLEDAIERLESLTDADGDGDDAVDVTIRHVSAETLLADDVDAVDDWETVSDDESWCRLEVRQPVGWLDEYR